MKKSLSWSFRMISTHFSANKTNFSMLTKDFGPWQPISTAKLQHVKLLTWSFRMISTHLIAKKANVIIVINEFGP